MDLLIITYMSRERGKIILIVLVYADNMTVANLDSIHGHPPCQHS